MKQKTPPRGFNRARRREWYSMSIHHQPNLFSGEPPAARQARGIAASVRARVLDFLDQRGSAGATGAKTQAARHLDGPSQRIPRVALIKAELICDSGQTRATPAGRAATIWSVASAIEGACHD